MSALPSCEVLLLTFSTGEAIRDDIAALCSALREAGLRAHVRILTERLDIAAPAGIELVHCERGSKLSKLKAQLRDGHTPTLCVLDSDMHLRIDACRDIVLRAVREQPGIAFGLVESQPEPGVLGRCVQLDKYWSHRCLRPLLLRAGIGITVPGQFVVYSPALLAGIADSTDTFLDDLYFGLRCRQLRLPMLRVPQLVGYEEGRSGWHGLLAQRTRWMKGLFRLTRDAWRAGSGAGYCAGHYLAYHGLPAAYAALTIGLFCSGHMVAATGLLAAFLLPFTLVARSLSPAILVYAATFPAVHVLASIGAVLPFSTHTMRKR